MADLRIGSRVTVAIERLSLGGDGVSHIEGCVVFIPYACPGDTLEVEITEARPRFARARVLRVIEPSGVRTEPPCPYHFRPGSRVPSPEVKTRDARHGTRDFRWCGGCSWQHLTYEAQLMAKQALVQETLERIGGLQDVDVRPMLGMENPWRYRNKVQMPVGEEGYQMSDGRWQKDELVAGFFAPNSHDIVAIEDCLVQPELSVRIVNRARALLERFGARAYDEQRHSGWIRHLLVRTRFAHRDVIPAKAGIQSKKPLVPRFRGDDEKSAQALLVFVTRTPEFPHEVEMVEALAREFPDLVGIHQNVQPSHSNVILGRQWRQLAGADCLEERLGDLRFQLSPGSFFQVNTLQAKVLYDVVREMSLRGAERRGNLSHFKESGIATVGRNDLPRDDTVLLDVYCGVGAITLWLAKDFKQVVGVDEVPGAIRDAERNARLNNIQNARFFCQPAEQFLGSGPNQRLGPDPSRLSVILDPPRAGCSPAVLRGVLSHRPSSIVYVSCDPGTLARDLAILTKGRYRIEAVQPVDLFPHTPHIETVVLLANR